ncbi:MAG: hypothetical protein WDN00_00865 [Limisphaerales bacterium]
MPTAHLIIASLSTWVSARAVNPWVLVLSSHAIPIVPQFLEVHRHAIRQFPADVAVGYAPSTISAKTCAQATLDEVHFYNGG